MEMNRSHLNALELGLSNERARLANSKTVAERELRAVWGSQLEKEVAAEREFLGLTVEPTEMSDDELLAQLTA